MAARIRRAPPHWGHSRTSISKTRLMSSAQGIQRRRRPEAAGLARHDSFFSSGREADGLALSPPTA
ncbi:MAG: hypothetical protein KJO06_11375, partial [Gemmatimonadetes bacterium]|nr:hypothetical protein [Gemmatimonadota bacterium]